MQAQTSQQCVVVSFDTYCMNARGKINIYDIPILSFNISLDNPNLANLVSRQVPHEHILTKAYEGTRKKNNHKFRHIAVNTSQYRQSFFPKTVGPWNQLSFADSPTLENFRTNLLSTNRP